MTRVRRPPAGNQHGIPADLPPDGTPFTVVTTTTHQKKMGDSPMDQTVKPHVSVGDFENAPWNVYIQGPDGFQFIEKLTGRPYDPDLQNIFGPGRFKTIPIGPEGKPLDEFTTYHKIKDPTADKKNVPRTPEQVSKDWGMSGDAGTEMPAWMRLQMQEAREEKREARRRADEATIREAEWKREQSSKDYERRNREDNEARAQRLADAQERKDRYDKEVQEKREKDDRERDERRFRVEQQNNWMKLGAGLVTAFIETRNAPQGENLNSTLISALVNNAGNRPKETSIVEQIQILSALDDLRGSKSGGEDNEDSDFMKMMGMASSVVPAIAAMRGGGGGANGAAQQQLAGPPQQQQAMSAEEIGMQIMHSPEAISKISMKDPTGSAAALVGAVKGNPALKDAIIKEFQKQGM